MNKYIVVRGAGDLATGIIQKLYRAGFNPVVTEVERPTAIRRLVALSECMYEGEFSVENISAKKISHISEIYDNTGFVPILADPSADIVKELKPFAVVDAIIAKKNLGTNKSMADITIALGPGFKAPEDVDCVIETMRGHNLGRLIFDGEAMPNTGIPGYIKNKASERVIYSPSGGKIKILKDIGKVVNQGDVIAFVGNEKVYASIDGVLRGIMRDGFSVVKGMKIGDIDPRLTEIKNCSTISDKARNLGGAVLEAILFLKNKKGL